MLYLVMVTPVWAGGGVQLNLTSEPNAGAHSSKVSSKVFSFISLFPPIFFTSKVCPTRSSGALLPRSGGTVPVQPGAAADAPSGEQSILDETSRNAVCQIGRASCRERV